LESITTVITVNWRVLSVLRCNGAQDNRGHSVSISMN